MRPRLLVLSLVVALVGILGIGPARLETLAQEGTPTAGTESLTDAELQGIIDAAVAGAEQTPSALRVDAQGIPVTTRMHIAIVDRNGHLLALHSIDDAWPVSIDIALAKAYTAAAVSSKATLTVGLAHRVSAYDASYLELAMRRGLPLATQDERLMRAAGAAGIEFLQP